MYTSVRLCLAAAAVTLVVLPAAAQERPPAPATSPVPAAPTAPAPAPAPAAAPAPVPTGDAATVNGQPIPELALQRALKRVPPARHAEARPELLDFLVGNLLVEQYLLQLNVTVDKKEVDAKLEQIYADIKKNGQTVDKVMKDLMLTEDELRSQVTADLRWEKYANQQATEKVLRDLFESNREAYDGSMVRARHILFTPDADTPVAGEQAKVKLQALKKSIEDAAAEEMKKETLPPQADNLIREQARTKVLDRVFAKFASDNSKCPSKADGGDVGWFPRAGSMVEPFAQAAFALKPYQMSDVVMTQYGYHLILATDRRPGKETKFEDAKDDVKEDYCDRLRQALISRLRPAAKIVINPPPKS